MPNYFVVRRLAAVFALVVPVAATAQPFFDPLLTTADRNIAVVSCYSADGGFDPARPTVDLIDLRTPGGGFAYPDLWSSPPMSHPAPATHWWSGNQLGQVFGLALGQGDDIYAAVTGIYGDNTGDGNTVLGPSSGHFAPDPAVPGSPLQTGAIWLLDPTANFPGGGTYRLLANLPNGQAGVLGNGQPVDPSDGAPGLGQLAYDPGRNVVYVSNFYDGLIYAVDGTSGVQRGTLDHGADVLSLPSFGGAAVTGTVLLNNTRLAALGRRIWAVQYHPASDRLNYAVWEHDYDDWEQNSINSPPATGPNRVFSVALDATGVPVAATARLELIQPLNMDQTGAPKTLSPISDITFSEDGQSLFLAERGAIFGLEWVAARNRPGQGNLGAPHNARVLRFNRAGGIWVLADHDGSLAASPDDRVGYFVGASIPNTNSSGGIALAHDYSHDPAGRADQTDAQAADGVLWSGVNSYNTDNLSSGSSPNIYGLQSTRLSAVKPNTFADEPIAPGDALIFVQGTASSGVSSKTLWGDIEIRQIRAAPDCTSASGTAQCRLDGTNTQEVTLNVDHDQISAPQILSQIDTVTVTPSSPTSLAITSAPVFSPPLPLVQGGSTAITFDAAVAAGAPQMCFALDFDQVDAAGQTQSCCKGQVVCVATAACPVGCLTTHFLKGNVATGLWNLTLCSQTLGFGFADITAQFGATMLPLTDLGAVTPPIAPFTQCHRVGLTVPAPGGIVTFGATQPSGVFGQPDLCCKVEVPIRANAPPKVTLEKVLRATPDGYCLPGDPVNPCVFDIVFRNAGPGDLTSPLGFDDILNTNAPVGLDTGLLPLPWVCPVPGIAQQVQCDTGSVPVTVPDGGSLILTLPVVPLPGEKWGDPIEFKNCVRAGGPSLEALEHCVEGETKGR